MNNMEIYDIVRSVPDSAKKTIQGGRLNGKTDIRPQWRIQTLTEMFGPCGYGWKYEITCQRLEKGEGKEVKAFVDILLYVKWGEEWSAPIPGIGGNTYIDSKGYCSDECFKMALTDAISVAAKALGVGADVYMGAENTKYTRDEETPREPQQTRQAPPPPANETQPWICEECGREINGAKNPDGTIMTPRDVVALGLKYYGQKLCVSCARKRG